MPELKMVQISEIRENPVALRTVQRESEEYLGIVASIKEKGFMGSITMRPQTDKETDENFYELVDGLQRFNAAKDAGLLEIPANIMELSDALVLEAQIVTNIHKVETKPAEYTAQLKRILAANPMMTEAELAGRLGKSPQWINQRLSLTKISNEEIIGMINEGKICLANAYALAKLPQEEQPSFVDRATTQPPDEFVPAVQTRAKEIRDAKRKGLDSAPIEFTPTAHMRKLGELKQEFESSEIGPALVKSLKVKSAVDGFATGVAWSLHMDARSVEAQKSDYEARQQKKKDDAAKRKAEQQAKKAKNAKEKADEAAKMSANAQAELDGKKLPYPELSDAAKAKAKVEADAKAKSDAGTEGGGDEAVEAAAA
jgi:ParB/RepB/Spo0J family partition protein